MNIVFFGSGDFAVKPLACLRRAGHKISLVVTQPDRRKGRHLGIAPTPVKEYSLLHGLKIFQPHDINLMSVHEVLKKNVADIFVVVSYGKILKKSVLDIPKIMCINIHASLLPKYRGAAPVSWALIKGEKETGITFIRMSERMDAGDIIFQKGAAIDTKENSVALDDRLSSLAGNCINDVLKKVCKDKFKKQDEKEVTYAPLMKKEDGLIRWKEKAQDVFNRFRGCYGWPGSFTYLKGKLLKILDMEPSSEMRHARPGEVLSVGDDYIEVACLSGSILIKEVLPASGKRMSINSFLAGHKISPGEILGK